jgi:ferredoxin
MMRISVDNDVCSGHARCNAVSPELFTLDDLGYSDIGQGKEVSAGLEDKARQGVRSCPERALSIDE